MKKMKIFILIGVLAALSASAYGQVCCRKVDAMQTLALNTQFKIAHEAPEPLEFAPAATSQMVYFPTTDGKEGSAFYIPAKGGGNKVLIIFHEWWGLNAYIKREAERLQASVGDIDVYAIDLYDGTVATDAETAGKLMNELKEARAEAIINGLLKKIGKDKKIATLGWCMGGSWSFTGAVAASRQAVGCVMYYGFPETDNRKIRKLTTDILYIRGTEDKFIDAKSVVAFGKRVEGTGHSYTQKDFKADHAFANPSNPHYNAAAATEAMKISVSFLKKVLGI